MPDGSPFTGRIPHFFDLLSELAISIPIQSQWVLLFQGFPTQLITQVTQFEGYQRVDQSSSWSNVKIFVDAETSDPLQQTKGCIFAQKINTPSEGFETNRVGDNYKGGFVKGPVSTARKEFNTFDVSFLETSLSFADMVLRPWSIMASHHGLMAREGDTTGNQLTPAQSNTNGIKANISVFHLGKAGAGVPMIVRKQYNFYDCVPTSISSESYTYIQDEAVYRDVSFLYSYYTSDASPEMVQ